MQKKLTVLFTFAIFVLLVGWAVTPAQAHHKDDHDKGGGGGGNGDPEPTIEECVDENEPCIADVGKTSGTETPTPASEYNLNNGYYVKIESNEFDKILQTLTEEEPAVALCNAYDVLVFNWNSPTIKNLNWQRLLDYMACGGGIIFEDQRNVLRLADGVSIIEATRSSPDDEPITVNLVTVPVLTTGFVLTTLDLRNKHIIFDEGNSDVKLHPFLTLAAPHPNAGKVVGLYGQFGDGRIVLTGPDNNFHGRNPSTHQVPEIMQAIENSYDLLHDEIDWLLDVSCGDTMLVAPEQCDDGGNVDGDGCSAACIIELP